MSREAVVIGAGAIGMASAFFLKRAGFRVTVVDRGEVGHGCSYGNSCLIVPSHSDPLPGPGVLGQALRWMTSRTSPFYVRPRLDRDLLSWSLRFRKYCNAEAAERGYRALAGLSRGSLELYEELTSTKEIEFFFERRGLLEIYLSEKGPALARRGKDVLEEHGFFAKVLSADEARALEPALSPAVRAGLFIESEAHGFSYGYVRALAAAVEKRGGRLLTRRPVSRIVVSGRRVKGVALADPEEKLDADVVVLAAGSWSKALAAPLGIEIPLQPAKGYSATIDTFEGAPTIPILIQGRRVIVTPLGDRLRFGGTLELAGLDASIDKARYGAVVRAAREALAADFPMRNEERWAGLRPVTPDGLPILDRAAQLDGLIVATGHAMLGFTQSPMSGKLVAELASGRPPSLPLAPFRLDRF